MPFLKIGCFEVPDILLLLVVYIIYLLFGATIFWALESGNESQNALEFQKEKWEMLKNYTCMDRASLEKLIQGIIQAYKSGLSPEGNTTNLKKWEFPGSFFFSITVVTTIGYGNLSPSTIGGHIFCIVFALFGIPLNIVLLNKIGKAMLSAVQKYSERLGKKFKKERLAKHLATSSSFLIGLLLFLFFPPLVFAAVEGWSYEEGFYYSFVTLGTIGFGDYVVGSNPERSYSGLYKILVALWILFGLAWLALIINFCTNTLEKSEICQHVKQAFRKKTEEDVNSTTKVNETELEVNGTASDNELEDGHVLCQIKEESMICDTDEEKLKTNKENIAEATND
ncbi:potassium channel subfamily K member 17 [Protopterus annectens]|uniref:potassium channel subfamily K member 17 n=1 Tax=Protopterus annectens TaxID=7888 RepID=UPI001CFB7093|nr:potassium channel subfamily K member 17 [Protopterus annectens]